MNETKEYLVNKIKEHLNTILIIEGRVLEDRKEANELQILVQGVKRKDPEASYKEMRLELVKIQENFYYSFLMDQQIKDTIGVLKELLVMAEILKIEIPLEGEQVEAVERIKGMDNVLFMVDKDSEVIIPNKENKKLLEEGVKNQATSEKTLEEVYGIIPV